MNQREGDRPRFGEGFFRRWWEHRGVVIKDLFNTLQKGGSKNAVFLDAKGLGHECQTWRIAFHDFSPRLFQPKK